MLQHLWSIYSRKIGTKASKRTLFLWSQTRPLSGVVIHRVLVYLLQIVEMKHARRLIEKLIAVDDMEAEGISIKGRSLITLSSGDQQTSLFGIYVDMRWLHQQYKVQISIIHLCWLSPNFFPIKNGNPFNCNKERKKWKEFLCEFL